MDHRLRLDEALDAMLAGKVEPIDPEMRRMVRLASAIQLEAERLSPERRAALKARVLRKLEVDPRPTLARRLREVVVVIARPLPAASRAAVVVLLLVSLAGGATAASAGSLPDDPLYGMKLTAERMRLDLAQHPTDRAVVELTIAESRLWEATALAALEREAEADAAVSQFGEHLASAAALLGEARPPARSWALVEQFQARFASQQERFLADVRHIAAGTSPSTAVSVLSEITALIASGDVATAAKIADVAARGAEHAASNASRRVPGDTRAAPSSRQRSDAQTAAGPRPAQDGKELPKSLKEKIEAVAKAAKDAAKRAREAADRARHAAEQWDELELDASLAP